MFFLPSRKANWVFYFNMVGRLMINPWLAIEASQTSWRRARRLPKKAERYPISSTPFGFGARFSKKVQMKTLVGLHSLSTLWQPLKRASNVKKPASVPLFYTLCCHAWVESTTSRLLLQASTTSVLRPRPPSAS